MISSSLNVNCDIYQVYQFHVNDKGCKVIHTFDYKNLGEKLEGSDLGDLFDIIIVPQKPLKHAERFRAILIEPLVYINRLLDDGFIGLVGLATTSSEEEFIKWENEINDSVNLVLNKGENKQ